MPKKPSKKQTAKKRTAPATRSSNNSAARNHHSNHVFHGGVYTTPRGNVTLMVPAFWSLRQTNDDLELDSPTNNTSLVVTAFKRNPGAPPLDSREYMERFLQTAATNGRRALEVSSKARTVARFKDAEKASWQVEFFTDGQTLLLATLNTSEAPRSPEARTGAAVLASIKLRKK